MFDPYVYISLALYLLCFWVVCWVRTENRRRLLIISLVGAVAGAVAEWFYFYDYWLPPTLMGIGVISFEDFLAGFALAGIPSALPSLMLRTQEVKGPPSRQGMFACMFGLGMLGLTLCTFVWKINSMIASPILFVLATLAMLLLRPDLWRASLIGGAGLFLIVAPFYVFMFVLVAPDYWSAYGLYKGTAVEALTWFNIPLTEFAWYASWGALAGIAHPFARGYAYVKLAENSAASSS